MLENAVTELKKENAQLRTHLVTELKNAVNDSVGATGATGRDGASVVGPAGPPGKDSNVAGPRGADGRRGEKGESIRGDRGEQGIQGVQGIPGKDGESIRGEKGEKGERGDVLIIGESEMAQAVIAMRIKLKEHHAKVIAVLVERIEHEKKNGGQHFARLLEYIKGEIEALR